MQSDCLFSILIPSWNNLPYLKLCVESLEKHSSLKHEIILHINEGKDGTADWAKARGIKFSHSEANIGVCHSLNEASKLATTGYISFFNDDMYALPAWDKFLYDEIKMIGHERFFLSATMIEPTDTGNAAVIASQDYGRTVETFQEEKLLKAFSSFAKEDWSGATWPPNVVPRKMWEEVGGYSPEFSPGMSSDPDFSMKLWQKGVRYFKGLGQSRVYHFLSKSTGRIVKNNGSKTFLKKWGITQGDFAKYFLRRGKKWGGELKEPGFSLGLLLAKFKRFVK